MLNVLEICFAVLRSPKEEEEEEAEEVDNGEKKCCPITTEAILFDGAYTERHLLISQFAFNEHFYRKFQRNGLAESSFVYKIGLVFASALASALSIYTCAGISDKIRQKEMNGKFSFGTNGCVYDGNDFLMLI